MKHYIALLFAVMFCIGGLTPASAAAPSMDLSYHHHHHWRHWHHHHYHHWHHHYRHWHHHHWRHY